MAAPIIPYNLLNQPLQLFTSDPNFMGVFLDQGNPPYWDKPYYSVAAPNQPIDGASYFLESWSASPSGSAEFEDANAGTTAVIFRQNNAQVTAHMKGHLASSTTNAIRYNNQRKIFYDGDNYHLVYEDNGNIYYTYSGDDGDSWVKEIKLNTCNGGTDFPSLAAYKDIEYGYYKILVVWQDDYGSIWIRLNDNGDWHSPKLVIGGGSYTHIEVTPVATYASDYFFIVWRNFSYFPGESKLKIVSYDPVTNTFGAVSGIECTNADSRFPSLEACVRCRLHLAWAENGEIYHSKIRYIDGEYHYDTSKDCVSKGAGYSDHVYPSITTDYWSQPSVMWQAYSGPALETQIILHRRRTYITDEWEWGTVTAFLGNDDYYRPSVTGFARNYSENLKAVWYRSTNLLWKANYDGDSWSDFYAWENGYDPTLSMNVQWEDQSSLMVFRKYSDVPYLLHNNIESDKLFKENGIQFTHHRRGVLVLGNSELAFELGEFEINGNPVNLFQYPDTLIVGHNGQWQEMFRTEPFRVSSNASLSYFRGFEVLNRDSLQSILSAGARIEFRLEVVDSQSGQVLKAPDLLAVTSNIPLNSRKFKNFTLHFAGTRNIFLRVGLGLPAGINIQQSMVEAYYEPGDSSYYKSLEDNFASLQLAPAKFELNPNYPNPFNPTTTITFDLPEEALVKLTIYDVTGRQIRTLTNTHYPAGSHGLQWDGKDQLGNTVASGVYVYRLVADSQGEAANFVQSRKMMLLK